MMPTRRNDCDAAIRQVRPGAGSVLDVEATPLVMQQTRDRLTSLLGRVPGDLIPRLMRLFDRTPAAELRSVIAVSLSEDDSVTLAGSVRTIANADSFAIDAAPRVDGSAAERCCASGLLGSCTGGNRCRANHSTFLGCNRSKGLLGIRRVDRRAAARGHLHYVAVDTSDAIRTDLYRVGRYRERGSTRERSGRSTAGRAAGRPERHAHDRVRGRRGNVDVVLDRRD